jgi:hypothetical protein
MRKKQEASMNIKNINKKKQQQSSSSSSTTTA